MGKTYTLAFVVILVGVLTAGVCVASVPSMMSYQGTLTNASGQPVANGVYSMRFHILDQATNGTVLWQEPANGQPARQIQVTGGLFNVSLGSVVPLSESAFQGSTWLQTEVNGTTLTPRVQIVSSGYAIHAKNADTVPDNAITSSKLANDSASLSKVSGGAMTSSGGNVGIGPNKMLGENPADAFTYDGKAMGYYALGWFDDSWQPGAPTAWLSGFNGIKLFTGAAPSSPRLVITPGGNVGIGTSSPATPLSFANIPGDKINLWGESGQHYGFGIQPSLLQIHSDVSSSDIAFGYGTSSAFTENVRIKGNGQVGIGTSIPQLSLSINGGMNVDQANVNNGTLQPGISFGSGSGEGIASRRQAGANPWGLDFYTNFTNRMSITNGGSVGIGATDPQTALDVNGVIRSRSGGFQFPDGTIQTAAGVVADNSVTSAKLASDAASLAKVSGGTMISASGGIGIGTSTPDGPFQVYGPVGGPDQYSMGQLIGEATGVSTKWQSFTCGTSGWFVAVMARFGTRTGLPWSGTLTIYAGEGTGGTALTSQAVSGVSVPEHTYVLQSPVSVSAGAIYTFSFDVPGQDTRMAMSEWNYSGGMISTNPLKDAHFATYVANLSTPEPLLALKGVSGCVGIRTRSPSNPLSVVGSADISGNLGVGTSNPTSRLSVEGNAYVSTKLTIGAGAPWYSNRLDVVSGNNWDLTNTEGDVRIGNSSYRLKIGVALDGGGAGAAAIRAVGGMNQLALGTGSADTVFIQNGKVGIGGGSPGHTLYVNGSASKPGGGSWTDSSDARLKQNIAPIREALERLLLLKGVTYEWIDPDEHGNFTGLQIGMIAQDVEKVFPGWVGEDAKGYKTLTFRGFEALAVEALRQQQNQIEAQQRTIDELRAKDAMMEARLAALEAKTAKD